MEKEIYPSTPKEEVEYTRYLEEQDRKVDSHFVRAYFNEDENLLTHVYKAAKFLDIKPILQQLNWTEKAVLLINSSLFIDKYMLATADMPKQRTLEKPIYEMVHDLFTEEFFGYQKSPRKFVTYSTFAKVKSERNKAIKEGAITKEDIDKRNPFSRTSASLQERLSNIQPSDVEKFKKSFKGYGFQDIHKVNYEDLTKIIDEKFN